jgi:hypothetical protein
VVAVVAQTQPVGRVVLEVLAVGVQGLQAEQELLELPIQVAVAVEAQTQQTALTVVLES